MSFVFIDEHAFEWPVKVPVPANGGHEIVEITGLFVMCDDVDYFAIDPDTNTPSAAIEQDIARLQRVFKGWKDGDVLGPDETPLEATEENIARFLARRPNRMAVSEAYGAAVSPIDGYRAKN